MGEVSVTNEPASNIREEAVKLIAAVFRKSDAGGIWRWKHEENPFGESRVVVARRDGRVIGIRPLMPVALVYRGERIRAVQCVDSAVDAREQRKGVFRLMCMAALSGLDDTLVFNTPNEKSYPAYMKAGWRDVGGLVRFWSPLSAKSIFKFSFRSILPWLAKPPEEASIRRISHPDISESLPVDAAERLLEIAESSRYNQIRLGNSIESLHWRTRIPDGTRFLYYKYKDRMVVIFYIIFLNGFTCVRLLDVLCDYSDSPGLAKGALQFIKTIGKEVDFLSLICNEAHPFLKNFTGVWPVRKNPIHFTVNKNRLNRADREIFTDAGTWSLMPSAFDYN